MKYVLNDNVLLGVATSATQIEGGDENNSWYDWYKQGKIHDKTSPLRADDHFNRYEEDLQLMHDMGIEIYRFGIEWSRVQPTRYTFDPVAMQHYRDEVLLMKKLNIKPLLTLHHFTNPLWFDEIGGFENDDCVNIFIDFIQYVLDNLGDIVDEYITINEPNVFVTCGYFDGSWPPGKKSIKLVSKVFNNMTLCHIKAYELIHKVRSQQGYTNTLVSFANHLRVFEPKNKYNPYHVFCAKMSEKMFQTSITKAMMIGECNFPLKKSKNIKRGKYYDFIGINYYTRSTVKSLGDGVLEDAPKNDLGWEIYPQGLIRVSKKMYDLYKAPIFITENGTCDNNDTFRSKYIYDHLKCIAESDLPIERYYHWSFTDNFEWLEGESARFGLVHINYENQKRTIKNSGHFYSTIIKNKGVTQEDYNKYL